MNKSNLRKELRDRRRALTSEAQQLAAENLAKTFFELNLSGTHRLIAFYWPADGEIDPRPLINLLLEKGKKCFLPVLGPNDSSPLLFGEYTQDTVLAKNRFGIEEPVGTEVHSAEKMDLILMPLVGFDEKGNRVGMGKGFYDRTLAFAKHQDIGPNLIGMAHECQQTDTIVSDTWDISLDGILTDERFLQVNA